MSEHCEVHFTSAGSKELKAVAKKDPGRYAIIEDAIRQVEENGWMLSTKSELIKVLDNQNRLAEIRDVGSGGYRLFLFWHDTQTARELWVCRVLPKRDVEGRARVGEVCKSVKRVRDRFLKENQ